jgi:hypothetical protein
MKWYSTGEGEIDMKKTLVISTLAFAFLLSVASAQALVRPSHPPLKAEREAERRVKISDRCQDVNKRIDTRVAAYDNNKGRHQEQHRKMVEHFQTIISRLETNGYDVVKLKADAKVLDEKIVTFGKTYTAFVDQLKVARGLTCGYSEGQFLTEMSKARDLLKKVQDASQDVRNYYQTVIRPDIKAVRDQKPKASPTASPTAR